jgi:DNA polymerase/3'-5' exonuclease PolX
MANKEISQIFNNIIQLLEIKGDKALSYKIRAYKNAISILDNLKIDIIEIYKNKGIKGIRDFGIGEKNMRN